VCIALANYIDAGRVIVFAALKSVDNAGCDPLEYAASLPSPSQSIRNGLRER
jgi:hypothetical protein